MPTALARLVGLNDDEWARTWPLTAYLFLTTAGTVASKATRDALFLDRFPAVDLPYVDVAIALLVGVAVAIYLRAHRRLTMRTLQIGTLWLCAAVCTLFWWLSRPGGDGGVLFIAIYLWVGIFGALAPVQVWTLANFVFTTREAKRAFGLIGGGAILGWIVGGFGTRLTAAWMGTQALLLLVAGSLVLSSALVDLVWRRAGAPQVRPDVSAPGLRESLWQVAASRYLRAIAFIVAFSSIATTVAGWQFKAIAKAAIPETDALTAYFGSFNMIAGVASLALQVMLTGPVLRAAGVGVALFIVPVAMAGASAAVLVLGSLAAVSALKASDQVLRYSIDKSTVELLYLPLSATETFRAKSFIDTVVYRAGDAIGGVAVMICATGLGLAPAAMTWVTLVAVAAWLGAAVVARREYVTHLQDSIRQHRLDAEQAGGGLLDRSATQALADKLKGTPDEILYALSFFESTGRALHPSVQGLLTHEAPEVRLRALSLLSQHDAPGLRPDVERLLADPSLEVRTEALLFLTRTTTIDPLTVIEQVGDFEAYSIQASMVAFLARPGRAQNVEAAQVILQRMVCDTSEHGLRVRAEAARVIAISPDTFERELRRLLDDDAPSVAREAVRAAARLGKRSLVHRLVDRLPEPQLTEEIVGALAQFGDRVLPAIRDHLANPDTPLAVRRALPMALQAIGTPAAQAVLVDHLLDGDATTRLHVITALNKLLQQHQGRPFDRAIVETAFAAEVTGHYRSYQVMAAIGGDLSSDEPVVVAARESLTHESERIFRLLKLLYPAHDLHSAFVGVQSSDQAVHDNALEFLDQVLPARVRAVVVPLFDRAVSVHARARTADRIVGVSLDSRDDAIELLALSRDPWLQACAAYAIGELRLSRFADAIDRWTGHADPLLRDTAEAAREKLKSRAASHSVSVG